MKSIDTFLQVLYGWIFHSVYGLLLVQKIISRKRKIVLKKGLVVNVLKIFKMYAFKGAMRLSFPDKYTLNRLKILFQT